MNLFDYLRGGCEYSIAITKKNDVDARLLLHCICLLYTSDAADE